MIFAHIAVGICMLLFGRKLFWLFVGLVGFIFGFNISMLMLPGQPVWVFAAAAICTGILGTLLAIFLQHVIIVVTGFLAGGYLIYSLLSTFGVESDQIIWISSIVCGLVCAALFLKLFDWSLILVSSLIGALLIARSIDADFQVVASIFGACAIAGIAAQAGIMKKNPPAQPEQ
ncbi:MAG TPA: TMEM198/TM7SF3 family protein [Deltaproteobacteria bacterium]|nr:TMEM198/TM7SF3 family protein [Deltaproteobacteria bacterium]